MESSINLPSQIFSFIFKGTWIDRVERALGSVGLVIDYVKRGGGGLEIYRDISSHE